MVVRNILSNGFKQIVSNPTHIGGGLLDHVYIKRLSFDPKVEVDFPYYTDHGAVSVFDAKDYLS